MEWVPLHVHSQYSILESSASIDKLVSKAKTNNIRSLALTDMYNLHGAVDFYKACNKTGIMPIIGCEVSVAPFSRKDKKRFSGYRNGYPLILLAKNKEGYKNLCKISSIGYLEGFYYTPRVDKEILEKYSKGIICLSGPISGRIAQLIINDQRDDLDVELKWFQSIYGDDYYLDIQRNIMTDNQIQADGIANESWLYQVYLDMVANQKKVNACVLDLAKKLSISIVASNETHYINRDEWKAHEILMNIQTGEPVELVEKDDYGNIRSKEPNPRRKVLSSHEHYFKSPVEMIKVFSDIPEAISNTNIIAQKCEVHFDFNARFYPVFVPPNLKDKNYSENERLLESEQFLKNLCNQGIAKRYSDAALERVKEKYPDKDPSVVVRDRLNVELDIITSKGMCDYLLIVYDFITWAKEKGIPVGPGRGSGAGSIILYLIGITDIEPLRFNLFFERFINPERMSYPDIDVDICMDRRSEVIEYTLKKYGIDKVAQIITFGTMKAKMAIKDVGRVLNVPLAKVNHLAKLVPEDLGITLQKAIELEPELQKVLKSDLDEARVLRFAQILEGSIRNTGIHAAGLIISGEPLTDHIPICHTKDAKMPVTQYSMKPVEAVGMLKIDFLGLKTLTAIDKAVKSIKLQEGIDIDWVNLPLDDQHTFNLLNKGRTHGVFQLESSGMQELAKQLHIDKFEEIIAVGALYRPGPMEMIPSFTNRKHGKEKIEVDHPLMEGVIRETYGIMVYQEQVMQIASILANYSLGEGDVLRRAMGKKDKVEMQSQREKFKQGALKKGIPEKKAIDIFNKIEKFASYGFNKSHAAAYGYLSYTTAYLKANFPKQWLAALMTSDSDDLTKVSKHIRECEAMGLKILPPDVNESGVEFAAASTGIRFAMAGIKGVGRGVVERIIDQRGNAGLFQSFYDFLKRMDLSKVGKKVIENFIYSGCFDFTNWTRQELFESVDPMYEHALREQKDNEKGVIDFLSQMDGLAPPPYMAKPQVTRQQTKKEILAKEKEYLGFYITGHPMDEYKTLLAKIGSVLFSDLKSFKSRELCIVAFVIEAIKVRVSQKSQKKFAILIISDGYELYELPVWPNLFDECSKFLEENRLLLSMVQIENEGGAIKLNAKSIEPLAEMSEIDINHFNARYEKLKKDLKRDRKPMKKDTKDQENTIKKEQALDLTVDADSIRLSEIVHLKKIFSQFSGTSPVTIEFKSKNKIIGTINIDSNWGVETNDKLTHTLSKLAFVQNFAINS